MDRPKQGRVTRLPVTVCPACGGTWFREATLHRFVPEQLEFSTLPWGCERGRISQMPMPILICLCGHGMFLGLGGVRGGRTPNLELMQFRESADCAGRYERFRHDPAALENIVAQNLVAKDRLRDLRRLAAGLERQTGQLLAHRKSGRSKQGRHWTMPKRDRATKSKGRDWLAMEIQKCGLTFDEARAAVTAIFDSMASTLQAGESVETPLGRFRIVKRTKSYRRFRFGKFQTMHRQPSRVVFEPNPDWTGWPAAGKA